MGVVDIKGWNRAETLPPAITRPAPPRWPQGRIAAVEALWGQGFALPGGGAEALRLVQPMALSSGMTLLLLGAGLGGPAQAISTSSGAWVISFEADAEQRTIAASRGQADAMKLVTVAGWDRAAPAFRPLQGNHALLLEALRGAPPVPVLESLAGALSADCQIVLTELVADGLPGPADREFAAWCRLDNRLPAMPRAQEVTDALQALGFDVKAAEDVSHRHINQTLDGWRDAVRGMAAGPRPTAHNASVFVSEAELWLLRIRLMRRLGVRLMRWHATRSG